MPSTTSRDRVTLRFSLARLQQKLELGFLVWGFRAQCHGALEFGAPGLGFGQGSRFLIRDLGLKLQRLEFRAQDLKDLSSAVCCERPPTRDSQLYQNSLSTFTQAQGKPAFRRNVKQGFGFVIAMSSPNYLSLQFACGSNACELLNVAPKPMSGN